MSYIDRGASLRLAESVPPTFDSRDMAHEFLGTSLRRWIEYLVAILIGNAIYYFSLAPHLPASLRHEGFHVDWGVLVDFVVCVAVYGLLRLGVKIHRKQEV